MRFYNREKELARLNEIRQRAFTAHSQLTVVTGRRRIGKTKLILKSCEDTPTVYLFVSRSNEATLCSQFADTVRAALGEPVPEGIRSFPDLFAHIMMLGRLKLFNLVIDEIQELYVMNSSIFSRIQDIWDRNKDITRINFIASGSVHSLMHKIFLDYSEPLYGRCDTVMRLRPFTTGVLREILTDYAPAHTNDDLLTLYTITGGVPKYVELLMDRGAFTVSDMMRSVCEENSIFLEEGTILLSQEFGKRYGNYYSILSAIASGRNTAAEITQAIGDASVGGMLSRLEDDYELIARRRPVMAKERSQNVRYEISDNFLRLWFRYVARNQDIIQIGQNQRLYEIMMADYPTYSGFTLERWFRSKLAESGRYRTVGSWWNTAKAPDSPQDEIDIVALPIDKDGTAYVAEVKRQAKNFKPELFENKVRHLKDKILHNINIESHLLTLADM
ncbi:MAG: ATP-binding protein [Muribaculaceae bacterium]|nr:ATP-binding protein [Muribaculaceae bacterium]